MVVLCDLEKVVRTDAAKEERKIAEDIYVNVCVNKILCDVFLSSFFSLFFFFFFFFFFLLSFSFCVEVSNLVTTNFKRKKTSSAAAAAAAAAIQLTMVSKMMDDGEEKKSKTTTTTKKSVLERLEPKTKTIRKESRNNSPTTFYNNNNNNYNIYNNNRGGRGGRGRGFFDRGFNSRGGSGGGYRDGGRARLKSSLCNQFPAKKDAATGEVIVRCYGCVIIRVTTTGETSLYRENVESKNYAKALNVMNEHLKKIGFSVTSSSENQTTNAGEGVDSHIVDQEGGGGAPRWNVSGMKKFMLFVEGMTLPPPPSPGPGRGLALLLPTKV